MYSLGDRIAQLVIMPVPLAQYVEVEELSETERNTSGHGSTGH
jgi:dUTP pyrophosphatase